MAEVTEGDSGRRRGSRDRHYVEGPAREPMRGRALNQCGAFGPESNVPARGCLRGLRPRPTPARELRARGLGQLADKDQRDEKLARLIWQVLAGCVVALVLVVILGALS